MEKTQIVEALHQGICTVVFTKADGQERTMKCTLSRSHLPIIAALDPGRLLTEDQPKETNPNIVKVWDTEAGGWRSFSIDRVQSFRGSSLLNG